LPLLPPAYVPENSKNYNIDYFECAVNLEFKFKLNFDQERGPKIEKKFKIPKKIE